MNDLPLTPTFWNGVGIVGFIVTNYLFLVFDKGITLNSRVKDRDKIIAKQDLVIEKQDVTIEWQRETINEKDRQIADLTRAAQMTAVGFQKFGQAAEQVVGGDER